MPVPYPACLSSQPAVPVRFSLPTLEGALSRFVKLLFALLSFRLFAGVRRVLAPAVATLTFPLFGDWPCSRRPSAFPSLVRVAFPRVLSTDPAIPLFFFLKVSPPPVYLVTAAVWLPAASLPLSYCV